LHLDFRAGPPSRNPLEGRPKWFHIIKIYCNGTITKLQLLHSLVFFLRTFAFCTLLNVTSGDGMGHLEFSDLREGHFGH